MIDSLMGGQPREGAPKRDRLEAIFAMLATGEPARDFDEAHRLISDAFDAIETNPDTHKRMRVFEKSKMFPLRFDHGVVRCYFDNDHALFIRDNGAIDIRGKAEGTQITGRWFNDSARAPTDLGNAVFEKAGFDGKKVWEI